MAEGGSRAHKPRKMRQVRVRIQEDKQGPGNQTRSLETQENGSEVKADMKSSLESSLSRLVVLNPGHTWQSPGKWSALHHLSDFFQVFPVGLLCPYSNGDFPAKGNNDVDIQFPKFKEYFFHSTYLTSNRILCSQSSSSKLFLLLVSITPFLTLYIYIVAHFWASLLNLSVLGCSRSPSLSFSLPLFSCLPHLTTPLLFSLLFFPSSFTSLLFIFLLFLNIYTHILCDLSMPMALNTTHTLRRSESVRID